VYPTSVFPAQVLPSAALPSTSPGSNGDSGVQTKTVQFSYIKSKDKTRLSLTRRTTTGNDYIDTKIRDPMSSCGPRPKPESTAQHLTEQANANGPHQSTPAQHIKQSSSQKPIRGSENGTDDGSAAAQDTQPLEVQPTPQPGQHTGTQTDQRGLLQLDHSLGAPQGCPSPAQLSQPAPTRPACPCQLRYVDRAECIVCPCLFCKAPGHIRQICRSYIRWVGGERGRWLERMLPTHEAQYRWQVHEARRAKEIQEEMDERRKRGPSPKDSEKDRRRAKARQNILRGHNKSDPPVF